MGEAALRFLEHTFEVERQPPRVVRMPQARKQRSHELAPYQLLHRPSPSSLSLVLNTACQQITLVSVEGNFVRVMLAYKEGNPEASKLMTKGSVALPSKFDTDSCRRLGTCHLDSG